MNYAAKFIFFVLAGVVASIVAAFADKEFTAHEGANIAVLAIGAALLFFKKNTVTQPLAKEVIAVFTAVAVVLVSSWTDGRITNDEIAQMALAFFGTLSAFFGNNTSDAGDQGEPAAARVTQPRYIGHTGD